MCQEEIKHEVAETKKMFCLRRSITNRYVYKTW
nr:MAG TPA: hypothetical protein [Crassvirales sp.]